MGKTILTGDYGDGCSAVFSLAITLGVVANTLEGIGDRQRHISVVAFGSNQREHVVIAEFSLSFQREVEVEFRDHKISFLIRVEAFLV